jgi:uncharacterized flavoprotein (TIGR03862 family)
MTPPSPTARQDPAPHCAIVGAGPAGLMAAEVLAGAGAQVDLFDAMPSVGRKFLLAGKGGLNLTHAEPFDAFCSRFGGRSQQVAPWLQAFGPADVRAWAQGLGVDTFIGTSGRVFPVSMKAAPLLRGWLHRLRQAGVRFHMRHRWQGEVAGPDAVDGDTDTNAGVEAHATKEANADRGFAVEVGSAAGAAHWPLAQLALRFDTPSGLQRRPFDAVLLALGGASWARLGSDGAWQPWLVARGVALSPLRPSNCGFDVGWSDHFAQRHAGAPLKNVTLRWTDPAGRAGFERLGECVVTATGLEGSLVYAASPYLRDAIAEAGIAQIALDLLPARPLDELARALAKGRGTRSYANHLKEHAGLSGAKAGLLHEGIDQAGWLALQADPAAMSQRIKALPLNLLRPRPIDEAISSAGGVRLEALDERLMLRAWPGVFCAGEMLDWEAPTGGYLLTACLASGRWAAQGLLGHWAAQGLPARGRSSNAAAD